MLRHLPGFASVFVLAGGLVAAAGPAQAEPLRLDYELYARGFNAMSFTVLLDIGESDYDIRLQGQTKGVASLLFSFQMEARSTGTLEDGQLLPTLYRTANRTRSREMRWVQIDYGDSGPQRVLGNPSPAEDEQDPADGPARQATLDPVSGVFGILLHAMEGCSGTVPVFDGRRLYDFSGEDRGWIVLTPRDYLAYHGEAQICRLRMQRRSGFNDEYESEGRFPEFFDIWMAEVAEGAPPVPVRVEADTGLGAMRMYLANYETSVEGWLPPRRLIRQLEAKLESGEARD